MTCSVAPSLTLASDCDGHDAGQARESPTGRGQVIEIIDNGVDTAHSAFAGSVEGAPVLGRDPGETTLGDGQRRWVSEKILRTTTRTVTWIRSPYPAPPEFAGTEYDA